MLIAPHRRSPGFWTLLAFVLLLCYGCGGSSAPDGSTASESGRLVLHLSPASTPQRAQQLRPSSPLQIQAGDIDALRMTVASEALAAPLVFDCDLSAAASGPCEVTETPTELVIAIEIVVPRNVDLVVTVTIFNENGDATFAGTRTIRLTQGIQAENIVLTPVGNLANRPPVANAGADQTVPIGTTVTLTGHRSSDVDGDRLSFRWLLLDLPTNSAALLLDPATITPTFVADLDGDYIVQLIVNDGTVDSAADTVTIRTSNSQPVAHAGPDQTVQVNTTVHLDGTASSDVDGSPLAFRWSLLSKPSGSAARLANRTALTPTLDVDLPGAYVVQLVVNDGAFASDPDTVTITTSNSLPVANAGPGQVVTVGTTVTLTAQQSSDVDGDLLTPQWALLVIPTGSTATMAAPTAVNPAFVADRDGVYVAQLIVHDGTAASPPATVVITTAANVLPVANADSDQTVSVSALVQLDGSGSRDANGNRLAFFWALTTRPSGSHASLSDAATPNPTFVVDVAGTYVAQLIVNDGTGNSTPDTVVLSTGNLPPVANAGPDQTVAAGDLVQLDGHGSHDANSDALTFAWAFIFAPSGSTASLADASSANPTFTLDVPGIYVAQLMVNDGTLTSAAATVVISTINSAPVAQAGPDQLVSLDNRVRLDGSGSGDVDDDPLTFSWAFVALPPGSTATLSNPQTDHPTFVADLAGTYILQLIVHDGSLPSAPDSVVITASPTTLLALSLPLTLTVPLGQTTAIPVTLSAPAPAGGVVVNLSSNDPALIAVTTPTVTIPSGALSVNGMIQGGAVGTTTITASHANFVADTTQATTTSTDLFFTPRGTTLDASVPASITIQLQSASNAIAAPSSVTVALHAADPACVAVPATVTIRGRLVNAVVPLSYGGSASLPCSTTVTANAPNFTPDSVTVSVLVNVTLPAITLSNTSITVGAGLQTPSFPSFVTGQLSHANHGGVIVRIASSDHSLALIAPDHTTPGQTFIDVALADGQDRFMFVVQGLEQVTGTTSLQVSAPGFQDATGTLTVVQPTLSIVALNTLMIFSAPNNDFFVGVGIPDSGGTFLQEFQPARAGGEGFTATLESSSVRIGQLVTTATTGQSVTVQIAAGEIFSPFGLTAGGVAFDPLRRGTTTVRATINNFIRTSQTSVEVTVGGPGLQMFVLSPRVGAGLQTPCCSVSLNDANHGGVTVRVTSSNQNVLLLAPDDNTAGTAFIDVPVPNGQTTFFFVVQGRERATGTVTLTASATGFAAGTGTITVEQPALALFRLFLSTTLSANEVFQVGVGLTDTSRAFLQTFQAARQGGGGLLATVTNSEATVGRLKTAATTGQTVTVAIDEGQFFSSLTLSGGVAFDPLTSGTTVVAASIPDFIATSQAMVQVTVDAPHVVLSDLPTSVGAGLQTFCCKVILNNASEHGGVTVRVASSEPSVVLVAPDAVTPGAAFINVFVPNGQTNVPFVVQGVERSRGTALVTASAPGFVNATGTVTVEQAALVLSDLALQTTSTSADDEFVVTVWLPDRNNFGLKIFQEARVGGGGLTATLTSSNAGAGQLVTTASTGRQVSIQIPEGARSSPSTVVLGGVAFDPVATGATTVRASIPGFFAPSAAAQRVRVTP